MGLLSRIVFAEVATSASLGAALFLLVLFLQKASQLFSILVNSSATPGTVATLFLLLLPASMPFAIPLGVLAGTLVALSRMSNDGEIVALRAAGVPGRRVARPVAAFAILASLFTGYCTLSLSPWCQAKLVKIANKVAASQLTSEIQPRVFDETFPNTILYVSDVLPGQPVRWRGIFMADTTPANQRKSAAVEHGDGPRVTLSQDALVESDKRGSKLQMTMLRESSYEAAADPGSYYHVNSPHGEQVLEAAERGPQKRATVDATPTRDLFPAARKSVEASIELNKRFALPLACLLLALTGLPLGISSKKGGKSAALAITVFFAFLYYTVLLGLIGLAKDGRVKPAVAVWAPDVIFAILAVVLLSRLERPQSGDPFGVLRAWSLRLWRRLRRWTSPGEETVGWTNPLRHTRFFLLPQIVDTYVLNAFIYYFAILLGGLVIFIEVFTFFELLGDVFRNDIAIHEVLEYLFFLAPKLIYDTAPVSVLVAALVTFGVLAKNNEIIALKACGVSLYRLAVPVLFVTLGMSGALFVFDHMVVTKANIIQDGLRNKIKGNPTQTYLNPNRKWIKGSAVKTLRIFYYKHFDQEQGVLGDVQVWDVNPTEWKLTRHVLAQSAHWEPSLKTWIFENGWVREVGENSDKFDPFTGSVATFKEIDEPPSWFLKEVKTYKQLNFMQLEDYIAELRQSGFNTVPLQVQFHKKFAVPLFVFVMALLSVPFAFMTGSRGAMTGVGVSLGVAAAYFVLNYLFEQLGSAGQLPPALAAWAPDGIFALAGVWLMAQMRT
ncbi:MAG: LptF/LptG family permease [Bryobacteraceae bacterium]|nr:LptF/LptG family permease [Bryobacteraceae bacterium]